MLIIKTYKHTGEKNKKTKKKKESDLKLTTLAQDHGKLSEQVQLT